MRIGILSENFTGLSGASDFLKHIIFSMVSIADERQIEMYILIKVVEYRQYRGIKRWLNKQREIRRLKKFFKEFKQIKTIVYTQDTPEKAIYKYKLEGVLPYMRLEPLNTMTISYLYDCQHRHLPEFFNEGERTARDDYFQQMVNMHKKIIVNAQTVKDDLINFYQADQAHIFVLPYTPKIDLHFYNDFSKRIKKYNLPKRYFMMSNQFWVHKDHPTAFRAFAEYLKSDPEMEFIFTGAMNDYRRPEYITELQQIIKELKIEKNIRFLGLIPKEEQLQIMKGATAVVQTTLFEGGPGGGSVWDAISLGIPVILSDIKTNKTVEYRRVHFFHAKNAQDLCQKMQEVVKQNYKPIPVENLIEQSKKNIKKLGNYLIELIEKK